MMSKNTYIYFITLLTAFLIDWALGMSGLTINLMCALFGVLMVFITSLLALGGAGVFGIFSSRDMNKVSDASVSPLGTRLGVISVSLISFSFLSFMYKVYYSAQF